MGCASPRAPRPTFPTVKRGERKGRMTLSLSFSCDGFDSFVGKGHGCQPGVRASIASSPTHPNLPRPPLPPISVQSGAENSSLSPDNHPTSRKSSHIPKPAILPRKHVYIGTDDQSRGCNRLAAKLALFRRDETLFPLPQDPSTSGIFVVVVVFEANYSSPRLAIFAVHPSPVSSR